MLKDRLRELCFVQMGPATLERSGVCVVYELFEACTILTHFSLVVDLGWGCG